MRRLIIAVVALALAALASSAVAAPKVTGSIKIHGPTSIALGKKYHETVVGHISNVHRAYFIQMYEQTPAGRPCAKREEKEGKRSSAHGQGGEFIMHKSFRQVFHYKAASPGKHRFCVYVARFFNNNLDTHTIARASLKISYH